MALKSGGPVSSRAKIESGPVSTRSSKTETPKVYKAEGGFKAEGAAIRVNPNGTFNVTSKVGGKVFDTNIGACGISVAHNLRDVLVQQTFTDNPLPTPRFISSVTMTFESITPVRALSYLTCNDGSKGNRGVRLSRVNKYARTMFNGEWKATGEAITFDWNGNLIEGQHRMWAVVLSGKPITFLVVRGLEPESQDVINQSLPRGAGDWLETTGEFVGFPSGRDTAAVCREISTVGSGLNNHFGPEIVKAIARMYHKPFLALAKLIKRDDKVSRVMRRSVVRAAFLIALAKSPTRVETFVKRVIDGTELKAGSPEYVLREYLMSSTKDKKGDTNRTIFLKTLRAITAFLNGEKFKAGRLPKEQDSTLDDILGGKDRRTLLPEGLNWEKFSKKGGLSRQERAEIQDGGVQGSELKADFIRALTTLRKANRVFSGVDIAKVMGIVHSKALGGLISSFALHGHLKKAPSGEGWTVASLPN